MRVFWNTQARPVTGVSFGPGNASLVAGGSGGFDFWNLGASTQRFVRSHAVRYLYGCVYDAGGRWVYVADYLGGFRLLAADGQDPPPPPGSPYERHVTTFDLTPDGGRLVMNRGGGGMNRVEAWQTPSDDSFLPIWSLRDGKPVDPHEPYLFNQATWFTNAVAISPDGSRVVTAESRAAGSSGANPLLVLRQTANGQASAELGTTATGLSTWLAFAADSRALYAWDESLVERWDVNTKCRTCQLPVPGRGRFRGLAVHPSGRFIVTVLSDGHAVYWDPIELTPIQVLKCGVGKLNSVAVSRDGALLAAGGDRGQVVVWDVDR